MIEVYCDESRQDLLTSREKYLKYFFIGSLWLMASTKEAITADIKKLRLKHNVFGEIKWAKASFSKMYFYKELIDLFFSYGLDLRFRCICVNSREVNSDIFNQGDNELGFYKFYYQLLYHWLDSYEYRIFCDTKTNRLRDRLKVLQQCLNNSSIAGRVTQIQSLPSKETPLLQFSDFLLGLTGAKLNQNIKEGSAKFQLIRYFENKLGKSISRTSVYEMKFNVFEIRLQEGW